jgi:hypothetical protein
MSDLSDDEVDHLLSRGGLGREHKARLLQNVLASMPAVGPPRPRPRWRRQAVGALSLMAGLAIVALWWRPSVSTVSEFRAKGAAMPVPVIGMSCLGGSVGACPRGSRIAFWLEGGTQEAGFVTAYADPVGGGERVWYLTNEPTAARSLGSAESPHVIPRAVLVGPEQPSGRYGVEVILSRSPVKHEDLPRLASAGIVTRASFDLVVSP